MRRDFRRAEEAAPRTSGAGRRRGGTSGASPEEAEGHFRHRAPLWGRDFRRRGRGLRGASGARAVITEQIRNRPRPRGVNQPGGAGLGGGGACSPGAARPRCHGDRRRAAVAMATASRATPTAPPAANRRSPPRSPRPDWPRRRCRGDARRGRGRRAATGAGGGQNGGGRRNGTKSPKTEGFSPRTFGPARVGVVPPQPGLTQAFLAGPDSFFPQIPFFHSN